MTHYTTKDQYRVRIVIEERTETTYDTGSSRRSRWTKSVIDDYTPPLESYDKALETYVHAQRAIVALRAEMFGLAMNLEDVLTKLRNLRPDLSIEFGSTGGGINCLVANYRDGEYNEEILVGHAGETVGWSSHDRYPEPIAHGEFDLEIDDWNSGEWTIPFNDALKFIDDLADVYDKQLPRRDS